MGPAARHRRTHSAVPPTNASSTSGGSFTARDSR